MNKEQMMVLGLTSEHLTESRGALMHERAAEAFNTLQVRANDAGFQLSVASSYRSYERQLAIFNGKWCGERPVLDDTDRTLVRQDYSAEEWLHLILRFSALPGTSRHHWGTDIDIFDPTRIPSGESLQLVPSEYRVGGIFEDLTQWLDELIAANDCEGFSALMTRIEGVSLRNRGISVTNPWRRRCLHLTTDTLCVIFGFMKPAYDPMGTTLSCLCSTI